MRNTAVDGAASGTSFDRRQSAAGPRIAILGAGFSGMTMAIQLQRRGWSNFVIYEKGDDVGGTWRENTYPGVACDVPSHLYSFSFEPNPDWSHRFSPGGEILAYMKGVAAKHGLYDKIAFAKRATALAHDGAKWTIKFDDGSIAEADFLISGIGGLHEPNIPDFDGAEDFAGPVFHTAQWRHDVDLAGKSVAIIGSAASAVQVIPEIARAVKDLHVFQRTPNWVMPRMDYAYPGWARALFNRAPWLARAYRGFYFNFLEWRFNSFRADDNYVKRLVRRTFDKHIKEHIDDPDLRARLTPDYPVGCKRILISDAYFPALQRDNVHLVTGKIDRFEAGGVRTEDGALIEADAIILATGFKPFDLNASVEIKNAAGLTLKEAWADGIYSHKTIAVPDFPNFFFLLGPNSGLGHNSVVLMIEAQVNYILQLMERAADEGGPAALIAPRAAATRAFDAALHEGLKHTVWAGGCKSWYLDDNGRNYTLYSGPVRQYLRDMAAPDLADYTLTREERPAAPAIGR
ncbi:MAG: NAD(P)/FAD-dependent oxidoreductase [Pseudomonadota bacterium]